MLWSADQNRNGLTDSEECEQKIVDGFPHEKIMMINGTHERKYFGLQAKIWGKVQGISEDK